MKKFSILIFAFVFVLFQNGCKTAPEQVESNVSEQDSLEIKLVETAEHEPDPWVKYSYAERQGKKIFDHYCVVCHGATGEGDGFNSFNLDHRPHSLADSAYVVALSDAILTQVIKFGGRGANKSILMPAYPYSLNSDQISFLVAYIRTFVKKEK